MAKDRTQRYGTAAQFRKDIATIAAGGTPVIEGVNTVAPLAAAGAGAAGVGAGSGAGSGMGGASDVSATQALPSTQTIPMNATSSFNSDDMANLAHSTAAATPPQSRHSRGKQPLQLSRRSVRSLLLSGLQLLLLRLFLPVWADGGTFGTTHRALYQPLRLL